MSDILSSERIKILKKNWLNSRENFNKSSENLKIFWEFSKIFG